MTTQTGTPNGQQHCSAALARTALNLLQGCNKKHTMLQFTPVCNITSIVNETPLALHYFMIVDASPWYTTFSIVILPINSVLNPVLYDPYLGTLFDKLWTPSMRLLGLTSHTDISSTTSAQNRTITKPGIGRVRSPRPSAPTRGISMEQILSGAIKTSPFSTRAVMMRQENETALTLNHVVREVRQPEICEE